MTRPGYFLRASWWVAACITSAAAAERPVDFAYQMAIVCSAGAAQCRLTLPEEVYASVTRDDLGDIRVFNADGVVVPYAISGRRRLEPATITTLALPIFAVRGDTRAASDAIHVTIESRGAAMQMQTPTVGRPGVPYGVPYGVSVAQYIIDARAMTEPIASLRFGWADDAAEFSGRVRIEASDDFSQWHIIVAEAPLANLKAIDRQFQQTMVETPPTRARYWRVTWLNVPPRVEFTVVQAASGDTQPIERASAVVDGMRAGPAPGEIVFETGARLPLESVNLILPQLNSAISAELLSRRDERSPWHSVAHADFYRIQSSAGEFTNAAVAVGLNSDRHWLIRSGAPPAAANGTVKMRLTWIPAELDFLAQGPAPYVLAFGRSGATSSATALPVLPAAIRVENASLGARQLLGGVTRVAEPAARFAWKAPLLWLILGSSVLLLAWMALRLAKELAAKPP